MRTVATVLGLVGGVRPRARASAVRRRRAATMIAYVRPRGCASATAPDGCGSRAREASRTKFPEESRAGRQPHTACPLPMETGTAAHSVCEVAMEPRNYGSLPTATVEEPIARTHGRRRRALALVAAFVAVAAAARSRTRATTTAFSEAAGDVCLAHVAAGDTFLEVSTYTLPSKLAYAEKYGYRVLHYAATPTCCNDIDSYACTLSTVQYKYCALRDALTTGGAQSARAV